MHRARKNLLGLGTIEVPFQQEVLEKLTHLSLSLSVAERERLKKLSPLGTSIELTGSPNKTSIGDQPIATAIELSPSLKEKKPL